MVPYLQLRHFQIDPLHLERKSSVTLPRTPFFYEGSRDSGIFRPVQGPTHRENS